MESFPVIPHHGGPTEVIEVTGITNIQEKVEEGYDIEGTRYEGSDWIALMQGIQFNNGRSMKHSMITVPFNYKAFMPLYSTMGLRIRITLEDNEPMGGTFGNITFYCLSEDDPNA